MRINEKHGWIGKIKIVKKNIITGEIVSVREIYNRIMNNALDEIAKSLSQSTGSDMYLKHVAIGHSAAPNADNRTTLYDEVYRVPFLSRQAGTTGVIESVATLLDNEPPDYGGNITIREIGFFAGSESYNWNDGAGENTGLMISRVVISNPSEFKSNVEQINFIRTDSFIRG